MQRLMTALRTFWAILRGETFVPEGEVAEQLRAAAEVAAETTETTLDRMREGAVYTLVLLQREGRLVDFLKEDIDGYPDDAVGRAVRQIHGGCRKVLDEHFDVVRITAGQEGERVDVSNGFDAKRIRLTGNVPDAPPYCGVLQHQGWRASAVRFPERTGAFDPAVIQPSEVEV